jgi:hypothetical protein
MLNLETNFRNIFGAASLPVLDEVFFDQYEQAEDPRSQLFTMSSMDREIIQSQGITSLGLMSVVSEGEQAPIDSFNQSYSQTFTATKFAKQIGISDELMADARFGLIEKMVRSLGRSARETELVNAFTTFNNAFSSQTSWDGVALISASHTTETGNQSNTLAAAADLSYSSLAEAIQVLRQTKDNRGKHLSIKPKILLVSESDLQNALEVVQSPYKAGTANNNINALGANGGLTVISSPYLTDSDAWFVLADTMDTGLCIYDREGMKTKSFEDTGKGMLYYKCEYRQAIGVDDWRGIVGSPGV